MADREVGITILVKGGAKAAIAATGAAAKKAMGGVRKLGAAGQTAMRAFGASVVVANQALELGKKAMDLWRSAVVPALDKAMEFRDAAVDPLIRDFEALRRETELIQARFGDVLIPVLVGLSKGFGSVTGSISGLIAENQRLIGTRIVEFLESTANVLVTSVGQAVLLVSKAWTGWRFVIDGTRLVVNRFFELLAKGWEVQLGTMAKVARVIGLGGIAGGLQSAADGAAGLGAEFEASGDEAGAALETTAAELEAFERRVVKTQANIRQAIRAGAVTALEEVARAATGGTRTVEEQRAAAESFKNTWASATGSVAQSYVAMYEQRAAMLEADAKAQEAQAADVGRFWADTAITIGDSFATAFVDAALESNTFAEAAEEAGKQVIASVLAVASRVITAYAAEAAAAQFAANATLPGIGLIVGAGAASAAFAAVTALIQRLQGGGKVSGGIPGRDSVPAILTPGERVLTEEEDTLLMRFMRTVTRPRPTPGTRTGLPAFAGGGAVRSGTGGAPVMMGGGGVVVNVSPATLPPSRAQARRLLVALDREARDMVDRGLIFGGLAQRTGTL